MSRARQIPEWEEYDNEVSRFARALAARGVIRSDAYTTGADALANIGKTPSSLSESLTSQTVDSEEGTLDTGKIRDEL